MSEPDKIKPKHPDMSMDWKSDEALKAETVAEAIGKDGLTDYERGLAEQWGANNPTPELVAELRDCAKELAELEGQLDAFEATHPVDELFAIEYLTPEEAPNHPIRHKAKSHLEVILPKLNILKEQTNITPEKYNELLGRYRRFSQAVGIINKGKVDHTRVAEQ